MADPLRREKISSKIYFRCVIVVCLFESIVLLFKRDASMMSLFRCRKRNRVPILGC